MRKNCYLNYEDVHDLFHEDVTHISSNNQHIQARILNTQDIDLGLRLPPELVERDILESLWRSSKYFQAYKLFDDAL